MWGPDPKTLPPKYNLGPLKKNLILRLLKNQSSSMAKKSKQEEELLVDVGSSLSQAERFFEENKQRITIIAVALLVLVGGYFGYTQLYLKPLEKEAQNKLAAAQRAFSSDSLRLATEGNAAQMGFLDIASDYSATKAGNLANYYAGISYLHLGEYENAVRLLDEFDSDDPILSVLAKGAIGDAFLELDQPEDALEYYEAAAEASDNNFVVPFYLKKAGITAELETDYEESLAFFRRIKKDFPESKQAADVDKYIGRIIGKQQGAED